MLDPKHPLAELLRRDNRFHYDAYLFVFDALRFGQEHLGLGIPPEEFASLDEVELQHEEDEQEVERHVTGQELCQAIRHYAIEQYGLLARNVLDHWGVRSTGDFGEIVFNLIDIGQMRKTEQDRREDFDDVFEFADAFRTERVFSAEHCRVPTDDE